MYGSGCGCLESSALGLEVNPKLNKDPIQDSLFIVAMPCSGEVIVDRIMGQVVHGNTGTARRGRA